MSEVKSFGCHGDFAGEDISRNWQIQSRDLAAGDECGWFSGRSPLCIDK
jgi:hypothetical protein